MSITIQLRRDTAANWTAANPVLAQGEVGIETDTSKAKFGNGATAWNSLAYWNPSGGFTNPMTTLGDMIYGGTSGAGTRLAGDTSNVRKFLRELSSGGVATAPVWDTFQASDVSAFALLQANNLSDLANAGTARNNLTPWQFDVTAPAYGAKGDGKMITDLVLNSTTTATSASASFTSSDTGKHILIAGGAGSNAPLHTTITFVNSTTVTLATAASITASNVPAIYGTDDTAAIDSAYQAALTYGQAHGQAAVITGPPVLYVLAGATTKVISNSLHYNAQIPLDPGVSGSQQKFTPIFRFPGGGIAAPIFSQSVPQAAGGATFVSMLTGQTVDATYGAPSVIGSVTDGTESTSNTTWNNIYPVVDGLTIIVPLNPTIIGLDLRGCAGASVIRYSCLAFDTIANIAAVKPTNSWSTGLFMPQELNNDESFVGEVTAYGQYFGVAIYAHASAQTIKSIACGFGLFIGGNGNDKHGLSINYASLEACGTGIQVDGNSGITIPVNIGLVDIESVGSFTGFGSNHIQDTNNGLGGRIVLNDNSGGPSVFSISGGANCEIIAANQARAVQGAPSYTLGSAFQNPWWKHTYITLNSGTTTNIQIGPTSATCTTVVGTTTTAPVTFRLPSGWWLNITGTVKPTTFTAVPD